MKRKRADKKRMEEEGGRQKETKRGRCGDRYIEREKKKKKMREREEKRERKRKKRKRECEIIFTLLPTLGGLSTGEQPMMNAYYFPFTWLYQRLASI